jgi:plasmid stabilization system protein ParE
VKGHRFLREALEEYEDAIVEFRETGTPVEGTPPDLGIRRRLLHRFGVEVDSMPYDGMLLIVAVFHGRRRPLYYGRGVPANTSAAKASTPRGGWPVSFSIASVVKLPQPRP